LKKLFKAKFFQKGEPNTEHASAGASCNFQYEDPFVHVSNTLKTGGKIKVVLNFNLDVKSGVYE
jgi:hypothetical protein